MCWVIVAGNTPTAFRARDRETLLPTLHQLQRTQPDTRLCWFERNRLWTSPLEAREARVARTSLRTTRTREWRPGGQHKDPRARFERSRDERRAQFKKRRFGPKTRDAAGRPPRGPRRPK
jgi:hypothetical protein